MNWVRAADPKGIGLLLWDEYAGFKDEAAAIAPIAPVAIFLKKPRLDNSGIVFPQVTASAFHRNKAFRRLKPQFPVIICNCIFGEAILMDR